MNIVMVHLNQWVGFAPQYNLYVIDMNRRNCNCYNYGSFRYLARNCRNKGTGGRIREERRLEYGNRNNKQRKMIEKENEDNNLNREQNLILFN